MKTQICLWVAVVGLLGSCSDFWRLERKEERLYGEWVIEDAWFRENGALFRESVRREFSGDRVSFFGEYEGLYFDASTNNYYPSSWRLDLVRERDFDGSDDVEFYLLVEYYNAVGELEFAWDAAVNLLTYEQLNLRVNDRRGVFTFKLRRR